MLRSSSYLGGGRDDAGTSIAVGRQGYVVVAGNTSSSRFPFAPRTPTENHWPSVFIAEIDTRSGHARTVRLGGENGAVVSGVALGRDGSIYITGDTVSHHLPIRNAVQPDYRGGSCQGLEETIDCTDAFLARLRPSGRLIFSTYLGGSDNDGGVPLGTDLAVGGVGIAPNGTVYIASVTYSHDFPTSGTFWQPRWTCNVSSTPCNQAFLAAFAPTGRLIASTVVGATGDAQVFLAVNRQGHAILAGDTPPPGTGATTTGRRSAATSSAMFVLKARTTRTAKG